MFIFKLGISFAPYVRKKCFYKSRLKYISDIMMHNQRTLRQHLICVNEQKHRSQVFQIYTNVYADV